MMKKLKLQQFGIELFFTNKIEEFNKATGNDFSVSSVNGACCVNRNTLQICLGVFNNRISTLAHEVHHAVVGLNTIIGSPLDSSTDEHNAYLTGYITREFLKAKLIDPNQGDWQ